MLALTAKEIFKREVRPALGCTEPAAVALAAAAAASVLPCRRPEKIDVRLDPNVFKNAMAVAIPGAGGGHGPALAAALGALGGDAALGLQALAPVDEPSRIDAGQMVRSGAVGVAPDFDKQGIYISVRVSGGGSEARAIIQDRHDRLVRLCIDGRDLASPLVEGGDDKNDDEPSSLAGQLLQLSLKGLLDMTEGLDEKDLDFLMTGVRMNRRLAEYGLGRFCGLAVGRALAAMAERCGQFKDMAGAARILTAAAADARMAGVPLPAMSSAGSGNHGLTAVLPVWAIFDLCGGDGRKMLQSVGLSHLVTAYVKAHTGRLSAVCGCSIAAGAGAAAGCAHFLGGDDACIAGAVANIMADLAGVVCDGAKASCALKLATAAGTAVQAALLAMEGVVVQATDGLVAPVFEETAANLGRLSREGMAAVDRTLINIIANKGMPTAV